MIQSRIQTRAQKASSSLRNSNTLIPPSLPLPGLSVRPSEWDCSSLEAWYSPGYKREPRRHPPHSETVTLTHSFPPPSPLPGLSVQPSEWDCSSLEAWYSPGYKREPRRHPPHSETVTLTHSFPPPSPYLVCLCGHQSGAVVVWRHDTVQDTNESPEGILLTQEQ